MGIKSYYLSNLKLNLPLAIKLLTCHLQGGIVIDEIMEYWYKIFALLYIAAIKFSELLCLSMRL